MVGWRSVKWGRVMRTGSKTHCAIEDARVAKHQRQSEDEKASRGGCQTFNRVWSDCS